MEKYIYSGIVILYLKLASLLLNFPDDITRYINEFLENKIKRYLIYHTRLILLTINPSLYLLNYKERKYISNENLENISLNFKGIPFIFTEKNSCLEYNQNYCVEQNTIKNCNFIKKVYNYDKENFHSNNEKYNIDIKTKKYSKKQFLLRKHKENKQIFLDKKKKNKQLTLKKKYSFNNKNEKYLSSIYINEYDEYQENLIDLSNEDCSEWTYNYYDDYSDDYSNDYYYDDYSDDEHS